jgi:hypothetical protein
MTDLDHGGMKRGGEETKSKVSGIEKKTAGSDGWYDGGQKDKRGVATAGC